MKFMNKINLTFMVTTFLTAAAYSMDKPALISCDPVGNYSSIQIYSVDDESSGIEVILNKIPMREYGEMYKDEKAILFKAETIELRVDLSQPVKNSAFFLAPVGTIASLNGVVLSNDDLAELEEVRLTGYSHRRFNSTLKLNSMRDAKLVCSLLTPKTYAEAITEIRDARNKGRIKNGEGFPVVLKEVVVTGERKKPKGILCTATCVVTNTTEGKIAFNDTLTVEVANESLAADELGAQCFMKGHDILPGGVASTRDIKNVDCKKSRK